MTPLDRTGMSPSATTSLADSGDNPAAEIPLSKYVARTDFSLYNSIGMALGFFYINRIVIDFLCFWWDCIYDLCMYFSPDGLTSIHAFITMINQS